MTTDTLSMIYYLLFHSIISYGIIAWGGAYSNSKNLFIKLQIRLLKIINQSVDKNPMSIDQIFTYESLSYHYEDLQKQQETKTKAVGYQLLSFRQQNPVY